LQREKHANEMQLQREKMHGELQIKRELGMMQAEQQQLQLQHQMAMGDQEMALGREKTDSEMGLAREKFETETRFKEEAAMREANPISISLQETVAPILEQQTVRQEEIAEVMKMLAAELQEVKRTASAKRKKTLFKNPDGSKYVIDEVEPTLQ
jgi:hypothetical protein